MHKLLKILMCPLTYVVLYVVTIAGFAEMYLLLPEDFYAPYAKYEPDTIQDRQQVVDILSSLLKTPRGNRSVDEVTPGIRLDRSSIIISQDQISVRDDKSLIFSVTPMLRSEKGLWQVFLTVRLDNLSTTAGSPGKERKIRLAHLVELESEHGFYKAPEGAPSDIRRRAFQTLFKGAWPDPDDTVLELTLEQDAAINKLTDGFHGAAKALSGSRSRLLYFSVVTITTTGFGDVVPLTPKMRALAAVEATLGILLLGMFVSTFTNWLSNQSEKARIRRSKRHRL